MHVRLVFVLMAALSGCARHYPEGTYPCEPAASHPDCPPNWYCRADARCYSTPADASIERDGGPDTGPSAADAGVDAREDAASCVPTAPATEVCDGVDNDCDGTADGTAASTTCGSGSGCAEGRCVPNYAWDYRIGSSNSYPAGAPALDAAGNVYVGVNLGERWGSYSPRGSYDWLIVSLTSGGTLRWVRQFGSTGDDRLLHLVVGNGKVVALGELAGEVDFAGTARDFSPRNVGDFAALVVDAATGSDAWARTFEVTSSPSGFRLSPRAAFSSDGSLLVLSALVGEADGFTERVGAPARWSIALFGFDQSGQPAWSRAVSLGGPAAALAVSADGAAFEVGFATTMDAVDFGDGTSRTGGPVCLTRLSAHTGRLEGAVRLGSDAATTLTGLAHGAGLLCVSGTQQVADLGIHSGAHTGYIACVSDTLTLRGSWTLGSGIYLEIAESDGASVAFIGTGAQTRQSVGRVTIEPGISFFGVADAEGVVGWVHPIANAALRGGRLESRRFILAAFATGAIDWGGGAPGTQSVQIGAYAL